MNFKFTKIKTITITVISATIGVYGFIKTVIFDGDPSVLEVLITKFISFVAYFIAVFIPTYLIWSLFQKKDKPSSSNIIGVIIGALFLLAVVLYFILKLS
jgi:hypothetical protein